MLFDKLNKLTYWFIGTVFVFTFGSGFYFLFVKTPRFLFDIKKGLLNNNELMQVIGGEQGYQLYYSGDTLPEKVFHVTINGACPEASVTVNGTYSEDAFVVMDTVIVKCD